ncbi:tape measure protein [Sphingomonas sp. RP10(2022)]|uniref:Tape measure protein n=1 Tax=Sphingomonas liriopis TaxID=2949094 RepID=A0A9X2HYP1_9SPHN|nr:tape measure protein [Sphingomonas liriopis]MCP3735978.1 tape measure protein [Sphingomonas liriopis]
MKLSLVLQAVDRWSGPTKQAAQSTGELARGVGRLDHAATPAAQALARVHGSAVRLPSAFNRTTIGAERASAAIGSLARNALRFTAIGAGALGAGAVAGIFAFGRGLIENAAKFEQYQIQFETLLGSAQKAKDAMKFVQKFAKDTPYELDQVTAAFIAAKNNGIDPFHGAMTSIGDAASSMNKDLLDTVLAVGDGMNGQWERLLDLGIKGSTKGATASLTYFDKAGKSITRTVKKDASAIRDALLEIMDDRAGGSMAKQSKTLVGMWRNLMDTITGFELNVAGRGIFDRLKNSISGILDWTNKVADDGRLDRWAQAASDALVKLWDTAEGFIRSTDWAAVARGIAAIADGFINVVGWIGKAASAWSNWQNDVTRRQLNMIVQNNGIWGTGIGASSASEKASARRDLDRLDRAQYGHSQVQRRGSQVIWPVEQRKARPIPVPWGRPGGRDGSSQRPSDPKPQKLTLDIQLKGDGARNARVQGMTAPSGTTLNVNRGRAMGGAA